MALFKKQIAQNGVPLEYHRITGLNIFTNEQNVISITSYINKEQREQELEGLNIERLKNILSEETQFANTESTFEGPNVSDFPNENMYISPYTDSSIQIIPYDQYMTIATAYEYLKTLPEFEGAIDC